MSTPRTDYKSQLLAGKPAFSHHAGFSGVSGRCDSDSEFLGL